MDPLYEGSAEDKTWREITRFGCYRVGASKAGGEGDVVCRGAEKRRLGLGVTDWKWKSRGIWKGGSVPCCGRKKE